MIVELLLDDTQPSVEFWKQERLVLKRYAGQNVSVSIWSDTDGSRQAPLATYYGDEDGYVYIDVTDYLRASYSDPNNNAGTLYVYDDGLDETWDVGVTVMGLISPESVLIPASGMEVMPLLPPSKMLVGMGSTLASEVYNINTSSSIPQKSRWMYYYNSQWAGNTELAQGLTSLTIQQSWELLRFGTIIGGYINRFLIPISCEKNYALVEWISFTGRTRRHIFEVVKQKQSVREPYDLMPVDLEYREVKGREDSLTLRLDGLDMYDLWYYSDIITSSGVYLKMSADDTKWQQVQVLNKNVTIPDGEAGDGVLEIQVNWKRYDAVAL